MPFPGVPGTLRGGNVEISHPEIPTFPPRPLSFNEKRTYKIAELAEFAEIFWADGIRGVPAN
jgi:hypothetical protein